MPSNRPVRRLGLSDLMALVAAAGGGLAVFQFVTRTIVKGYHFGELLEPPRNGWTAGFVFVRVVQWLAPTIPFAAAWTGVVPLLRLRQPRPSLQRILRQPGVVACLAAEVGLAWATLGMGQVVTALQVTNDPYLPQFGWLFLFVVEQIFPDVGLAVLGAWSGLALSGRWRAVADWPDRLGRYLGCYWIVLGLLWLPRRYLSMMRF